MFRQLHWIEAETADLVRFFSLARDWVGNEERALLPADTQTTVPTNAPIIAEVTDRTVGVGNLLLLTNTVTGTPVGSYLFSLGTPVPFGATINSTNGVFRWTPNCTQASRTHTLTVVVTDTGNPNLRDVRIFTVTTRECVVPELDRLVLQAGDCGRVPVNLISTVPLTNLSLTTEVPASRLTNFSVEPIVPEICAAALTPALSHPMGEGEFYALGPGTCPGQFSIGTQQVAWLHFTAISNQSSAFVPLFLDDAVGLQPGGAEVRNFAPQAGRVAVIGEEPLLEAVFGTNGAVTLHLYGSIGSTNRIEATAQLPSLGTWMPWQDLTLSNLWQVVPIVANTNQTLFFRAVKQ